MRAVVISRGQVSWQERPGPVPLSHELLVRVEAAGLNGADLLQRAGNYPPPPGTPADQPGIECAGTVEAIGDGVSGFQPGDRVMGLVPGAGQAELAVLHELLAMLVPPSRSFAEAGGFPEAFCTAHDALFTQAHLGMGERVLVTGAAGGVGTAAVQLAVAAGAEVVAAVRGPALRERVADLGATCVAPEEASKHGPFDVVLELLGGPGVPASLSALAPWGRVVVIGMGAGRQANIDLSLLLARRATLRGSTLRNRALEEKAMVVRRTEHHVMALFASGRVKVLIEATYPFAQAAMAYERFAAGAKLGKIVLVRA
ncbi:MAG: zinc-binding dehydrogenase [Acidimicrobiales bacterium]